MCARNLTILFSIPKPPPPPPDKNIPSYVTVLTATISSLQIQKMNNSMDLVIVLYCMLPERFDIYAQHPPKIGFHTFIDLYIIALFDFIVLKVL